MQLRRGDVEQWMSHRRLPEYLRRYNIFPFFFGLNMFLVLQVFVKFGIGPSLKLLTNLVLLL